ncbi:MAG: hypothetical protein GX896_09435 [Clostridiales bacterium]|nr:hypothetical protein [Clostridiales bacterium]
MINKKTTQSMNRQMKPSQELINQTKNLIDQKQNEIKFHSYGRVCAVICCCIAVAIAIGSLVNLNKNLPFYSSDTNNSSYASNSEYHLDSKNPADSNSGYSNIEDSEIINKTSVSITDGFPSFIYNPKDFDCQKASEDDIISLIQTYYNECIALPGFPECEGEDPPTGNFLTVSNFGDFVDNNYMIYCTYTPAGHIFSVYGGESSYFVSNNAFNPETGNITCVELPSQFNFNWDNGLANYYGFMSEPSGDIVIAVSQNNHTINYTCEISNNNLVKEISGYSLTPIEALLYSINDMKFSINGQEGTTSMVYSSYCTFTEIDHEMYFTYNNQTINLSEITNSDIYFRSNAGFMRVSDSSNSSENTLTVLYPSDDNTLSTLIINLSDLSVMIDDEKEINLNNTGFYLDNNNRYASEIESSIIIKDLTYDDSSDLFILEYTHNGNSCYNLNISLESMERALGKDFSKEDYKNLKDKVEIKCTYFYNFVEDEIFYNFLVLLCGKNNTTDLSDTSIIIRVGDAAFGDSETFKYFDAI